MHCIMHHATDKFGRCTTDPDEPQSPRSRQVAGAISKIRLVRCGARPLGTGQSYTPFSSPSIDESCCSEMHFKITRLISAHRVRRLRTHHLTSEAVPKEPRRNNR